MSNRLQNFLNSLQWINKANEEHLEIFSECCLRFASGSLSENKITTISGHLEIGENVLKESLLSVTRLAINRIHLKNKGPSTIENAVLCSRILEERRQYLLDLIQTLSDLPDCEKLLKNILEKETKGTYRNSNWRMDIDVAQRSCENLDPAVNFVCQLETATGTQTLNLSPAMLIKLEAELQRAVNAVNKAKTARL